MKAFQGGMPWTQTMPLDELETALATTSIDQQQKSVAVKTSRPESFSARLQRCWCSIDGKPVLGRPAAACRK